MYNAGHWIRGPSGGATCFCSSPEIPYHRTTTGLSCHLWDFHVLELTALQVKSLAHNYTSRRKLRKLFQRTYIAGEKLKEDCCTRVHHQFSQTHFTTASHTNFTNGVHNVLNRHLLGLLVLHILILRNFIRRIMVGAKRAQIGAIR